MTWSAQVLHIVRKDLRESRVQLSAFAVLVLASTFAVSAHLPEVEGSLSVLPVLSWIAGAIVVALLVQNDSVAGLKTTWVKWPIEPSAMCAAKFLLIATPVLALPVVGQMMALVSHGMALPNIPIFLSDSARLVLPTLSLLLLLAVLTSDLQTFLIVALVSLVVQMACEALGSNLNTRYASTVYQWSSAVIFAWCGVTVAAAIACYLVRDINTRRALIVFTIANGLVTAVIQQPDSINVFDKDDGGGAPEQQPPLQISDFAFQYLTKNAMLSVKLVAQLDSQAPRIDLSGLRIKLTDAQGKSVDISRGVERWKLKKPALVFGNDANGSDSTESRFVRQEFFINLSDKAIQFATQSGSGTRLTIDAIADMYGARVIEELPLNTVATVSNNGADFTIIPDNASQLPGWTVVSWQAERGERNCGANCDSLEFGLSNRVQRELVPLPVGRTSRSDRPTVLPGPMIDTERREFQRPHIMQNGRNAIASADWLHDATMAIVLWKQKHRYLVHLEFTKP